MLLLAFFKKMLINISLPQSEKAAIARLELVAKLSSTLT
jgi:hypothetical protein